MDKEYVPDSYESSDTESVEGSTGGRNRNTVSHVCADNEVEHAQRTPSTPLKRMRVRNPDTWKCNIRKTARKEYVSVRSKVVPVKLFIVSTTKRFNIERRRKLKTDTNSRRKQSFSYYFQIGDSLLQVCKIFYLGTLAISQTPVYTAHSKNDISNIPETPKVGKHLKHKIPDEAINVVKEDIESFPKV
nr:unnamed protein product [Callosobruchus analis]